MLPRAKQTRLVDHHGRSDRTKPSLGVTFITHRQRPHGAARPSSANCLLRSFSTVLAQAEARAAPASSLRTMPLWGFSSTSAALLLGSEQSP
jgi:hypothetical protein